jgi:hypothetical protein
VSETAAPVSTGTNGAKAPVAPAPGVAAPKADVATGSQTPTQGQPRGVDGKFAPKDGTVTPGPTPAAPPVESTIDPTTGQSQLLQAPKTWRKEAAEAFSTLPAMVQAEITKREQDIFKGISQYKELAHVGQVFDETLKPFVPLFQRFNLNPADATKRALTAHFNLTLSSPATKEELEKSLLSDYGISLESLGVPAQEGGAPAGPSLLEQEVQALRAQLQEVGQTTTLMQRRHLEQVHSQVAGDVEKFASNPANTYFNELTEDMEQLIRSGQATSLPEAYEKAIWLNPAVRAKEVARLTAEQSSKVTAQSTAKVSEARRASAVNVRSQGHPTSGPATPLGSMDDTLEATMKQIKDRG